MAQSPFHNPMVGADPIAAATDPAKVKAASARLAQGILKSPDGKVFKSPAALTQYMRDHPDWVGRQQDWLRAMMGTDVLRNFLKDANALPSTRDRNTGQTSKAPFTKKVIDTVAPPAGKSAPRATTPPSPAAAAVAPPTPGAGGVHPPGGVTTPTSKARNTTPLAAGYTGPAAPAAHGGMPSPAAAAALAREGNTWGLGGSGGAGGAKPPSVFDQAIKQLMGLDPSVKPIDAQAILDMFDQGNQAQTSSIQRMIDNLPGQQAQDLGMIDSWMSQVGQQVDKARQRGIDMTSALAAANQSNTQGLMASLGGDANPANESVAAMGANNTGTLNALGAADAQYLADMGPLLKGEATQMKANEVARLGNMMQQYTDQLNQVQGQNSAAKAQLALQLAQIGQQGQQTEFQNKSGLLNTIAGLGLSGAQLDSSTMQALARLQEQYASIDAANARSASSQAGQNARTAAQIQAGQQSDTTNLITHLFDTAQTAAQNKVKSTNQQIADANQMIAKTIDPAQFPGHFGALAPPELVKSVLAQFRAAGADLRDPAVKKAASGAISSFGYKVDPAWVGGWN